MKLIKYFNVLKQRQEHFSIKILFGIVVVSGAGALSNILLSEEGVNALVFQYKCSLDILTRFDSRGLFSQVRRQEIDSEILHVKDQFKKHLEFSPFTREFY